MKSEPVRQPNPENQKLSNIRVFFVNAVVNAFADVPMPSARIAYNPDALINAKFENMMEQLAETDDKGEILEILVAYYFEIKKVIESPECELFLNKAGRGKMEDGKTLLRNSLAKAVAEIAGFNKMKDLFWRTVAEQDNDGIVPDRKSGRPSERSKYGPDDTDLPTFFDDEDGVVVETSEDMLTTGEFKAVVADLTADDEPTPLPRRTNTMPYSPASALYEPDAGSRDDAQTQTAQRPDTKPYLSGDVSVKPRMSSFPAAPTGTEVVCFGNQEEREVKKVFKRRFLKNYTQCFQTELGAHGNSFSLAIEAIAIRSNNEILDRTADNGVISLYHNFFAEKSEDAQTAALRKMVLQILQDIAMNNCEEVAEIARDMVKHPSIRRKIVNTPENKLDANIAGTAIKTRDAIKEMILVGQKKSFPRIIWLAYFYLDNENSLPYETLRQLIYDAIFEECGRIRTEALEAEVEQVNAAVAEQASSAVAVCPIVDLSAHRSSVATSATEDTAPNVEVGAAVELSDAELEGIADLQEINRVPRPDVVSPADEEQARRLANLADITDDDEDTVVTGVNIPVPRYPLPEGKKVTFGDGVMDVRPIEENKDEPVTQVRIINMGGEPTAPTIPPAPPKQQENNPFTERVENDVFSRNVASEKEGEAKPTLLQRIRQSKAFKAAVHTIAAGATMFATGGLFSGDGSGRLNSGDRHPDTTETVPAPAPLVAENNSDCVAPKTDMEIDDDVVFEEGKSKYEVNEKALEGSKLLAKMVHDGGFERSPGYNGDFSELNLRLNDNATPAQGVKIKQIYQRYATGQYKAETDPNGNSAPKSRAFYHESRDGFQNAGIGLAQQNGDWNINWKGGDTGSFVKITDANGEYIPFVKEVLLARGVLVEKGAADINDAPENVPTNYELSPEAPTVPAGPASPVAPAMPDQVIHTMNQQVEDVLDDAIELDESDFVEIDGIEVLADVDVLDDDDDLIELGDDDIVEIDGVEVLASEDEIKPHNYLAGYSENSSTVDSGWG